MTIGVVPRRQELDAFLPKQQELNFKWNLANSIFEEQIKNEYYNWIFQNKQQKVQDETFYNQCFDFDWRWGVKLSRVIREVDQLDKVKTFFKQHYEKLICLYKYYASYQPNGELWCWNQQTYQQFVVEAGIVDGRYFKLKDSLLCFIQSNNLAETKTHPQQFNELQLMLNPENCLVRYQLIEIFTLISIEKYVKSGLCQTLSDAVQTLFKHGLGNVVDNIPSAKEWVETKLYTEKCDNILRLYHQLIQQLFNKYSKRRDPKDFIGLFDFRLFLTDYKFNDIDEKTANIIFNMSLPTQIDELNKLSHIQMDLTSFIQSLARLADYFSFIPFKQDSDLFWTKQKCENCPLHIKLEAFILRLIKNSNNPSFQKEFDYQDNSLFHEDFESIKHGKEILEKTRKMIQKKVVGTISTLLMMKGSKDKDKNIYSLSNQAPSSFSIKKEPSSQRTILKQPSLQLQDSQFNIQQKKQANQRYLVHKNTIFSTENSLDIDRDNGKMQVIGNQVDLQKGYQNLERKRSQRKEGEDIEQNQFLKKRRSIISAQSQNNLKRGVSIHSSKTPSSPLNETKALITNNNTELINNHRIILQSPLLSNTFQSSIQSPLINSQYMLEMNDEYGEQIKDTETHYKSTVSTAISSSKKQNLTIPKIKIPNQSSKSPQAPSPSISAQNSAKKITTKPIYFFPKKQQYDLKQIKKSAFTQPSSINLISPRKIIGSQTNLKSPTIMNKISNKFSMQQFKKPK